MISKYMIATNAQKVINFLLMNPDRPFFEREIARRTGISYGSANKVLNQLYKDGILQKKSEGRINYYSIDLSGPYIREIKILNNLLAIEPLIVKLKPVAFKIVLYGSWASGTDRENSDIDLFIVSSSGGEVSAIAGRFADKINKKIQAIVRTPLEMMKPGKNDEVFLKQVEQGKVLWEKEPDENNV